MRCVPRRSRYIENVEEIDFSARLQLLAAYRQHGTTHSLSRMNAASERSFSFAAAFWTQGRTQLPRTSSAMSNRRVFSRARHCSREVSFQHKNDVYSNVLRHVLESITDSPEWQTTIQMLLQDRPTKQPIRRRPRERGAGGRQPSLSSVLRSFRPRLRQ